MIGYNIPEEENYFAGKYMCQYNQYLSSPADISGITATGVWTQIPELEFVTSGVQHRDHVHYIVSSSDTYPDYTAFNTASYIEGDYGVIVAPEGISYIFFLEHTVLHQRKGTDSDIKRIGPYQIDISSPTGLVVVASGTMRVSVPETFITVSGFDTLSPIEYVYIDGDVQDGPYVRNFIPYSELPIDISLTPDFGRKRISAIFKNSVGNTSVAYFDDVFLGTTKYYFIHTSSVPNQFKQENFQMAVTNNKLGTSAVPMKEASESGKLNNT